MINLKHQLSFIKLNDPIKLEKKSILQKYECQCKNTLIDCFYDRKSESGS